MAKRSQQNDLESGLDMANPKPRKPAEAAPHANLEQGLYVVNPDLRNPTVDIVVVPGFGADPLKCWTGPSEEGGFNWIVGDDGLRSTFKRARILRYAYASAWQGRYAIDNKFPSIVDVLLTTLMAERTGLDASSRPIIFIAHSMGGLVVGQALNECDRQRHKFGALFPCITACFFFGTPFRGTNIVSYMAVAAERLESLKEPFSKSFFELMKPSSPWLDKLSHDLVELAHRISPNIELVYFYESETIRSFIKRFPDNDVGDIMREQLEPHFERNPLERFVSMESATNGTNHGWELQADHTGLVKFKNPRDGRYTAVLKKMKLVINEAASNARQRGNASNQGSMHPLAVDYLMTILDSGIKQKHHSRLTKQNKDSWLLEDESFQLWESLSRDVPSCLWVIGPAGVGKTSASASAIDRIEKEISTRMKNNEKDCPLLAFFLCDTSSQGSSANELVKSLVLQLISRNQALAVHAKQFLRQGDFDTAVASDQGDQINETRATMSLQNLWDCLKDMLADDSLGDIYIVINNIHCLDNNEDTRELMALIYKDVIAIQSDFFPATPGAARRWLFTSVERPGNEPLKKLMDRKNTTVLDLSTKKYAKEIKNSLEKHVKDQLGTLAQDKRYQRDQRYLIQDMLIDHGDNKHWIDIQCIRLEALEKGADTDTIVETLGLTSATSLKALVRSIWLTVLSRNPKDKHLLNELLKALLLAFRSPSIEELSILAGKDDVEYITGLISHCTPMLRLRSKDGVQKVEFVNVTIKGHLLSGANDILDLSRDSEDDGELQAKTMRFHGVLAWRCFSYLEKVSPNLRSSTKLVESANTINDLEDGVAVQQQVLPYPLKFWLRHAIKGKPELAEDLVLNLPGFWQRNSSIRHDWLTWYLRRAQKPSVSLNSEGMAALHVAAVFGYNRLAESLLSRPEHRSECAVPNADGYTPLHVAAYYNRTRMATILLNHSYKDEGIVKIGENGAGTALHIAAVQGHFKTVKLLLEHGADPNALNIVHGPVVNAAVLSGNNEMVQYLLEHKNINLDFESSKQQQFPRPLALSAARSNRQVFEDILVGGKDKWNREDYAHALIDGCYHNRLENVKLLVSLNQQHRFENEALEKAMLSAALVGNWTCIQAILDLGRDGLECSNIFYLAAIAKSNTRLSGEVLQKVWETCRSTIPQEVVNAALYQATDNQKKRTVDWLLDHCNADANATDRIPKVLNEKCFKKEPAQTFGNALTAAAWDGTLEIVEKLLQHGAQVESLQGCALQFAAAEGKADVVRLLIQKGTNVNRMPAEEADYKGPKFDDGTALQAACCSGRIDAVRVLLESKADPNVGRGPWTNPLTAATQWNYPEILEALLKAPGIQVNTNGGSNGATPLMNAALHMSPKEVKQLLAARADVNQTDSVGDTALIIAAERGDAETLKLLCKDGATLLHYSAEKGFALTVAAEQGNIECVRVLAERLSPLFGGLNRAIERGSTFVRDLVANPKIEQEIVDMKGFHSLRQDNIKLEQQLKHLHSLQERWDAMEAEVRQANIDKGDAERRMERMAIDRVEEKELVEKERGEYEAARFGFQRVRQENDALKRDLATCQNQLAVQQGHDATLEEDLRQSRLEAESFQKNLTTCQNEVEKLKQELSKCNAELNTKQDRNTTLEADLKSLHLKAEGSQRRNKILENGQKAHEEKIALLKAEVDEAKQKSNSLSVGPNGDHDRASTTSNDMQRQDGMSDIIISHDEEDAKSKSSDQRPWFSKLGNSSSSIPGLRTKNKAEKRDDSDDGGEGSGEGKKRSSFLNFKKNHNAQ